MKFKANNVALGILIVFIIVIVGYMGLKDRLISKTLLIDDFEGELSQNTLDYGIGGDSQIKVESSKEVKYHGNQAVKLQYKAVSGGYMWLARGYNLDVKGAACWLKKPSEIYWHKYKAVSFFMYGENSNAMLAVDVIDANFEYFRYIVRDDFSGWKEIICPFEKFFARGDWQPDKAKKNAQLDFPINAFQFEPRPISEGTLYFDCVNLIKKD